MERKLPYISSYADSPREREELQAILENGGQYTERKSFIHTADILVTSPLTDESHLAFQTEVGDLHLNTTIDAYSKSAKGGRHHDGEHYSGTGDFATHAYIRPELTDQVDPQISQPFIIVNKLTDNVTTPPPVMKAIWESFCYDAASPLQSTAKELYILFGAQLAQPYADVAGSVLQEGYELGTNGSGSRESLALAFRLMLERKTHPDFAPEINSSLWGQSSLISYLGNALDLTRQDYDKYRMGLIEELPHELVMRPLPTAQDPNQIPSWYAEWETNFGPEPLTYKDFLSLWAMTGPTVIQIAAGYKYGDNQYLAVASSNPHADLVDSVPLLSDRANFDSPDGNYFADKMIQMYLNANGNDPYLQMYLLLTKAREGNYGISAFRSQQSRYNDTAALHSAHRHQKYFSHVYSNINTNIDDEIFFCAGSDGWVQKSREQVDRTRNSLRFNVAQVANSSLGLVRNEQLFRERQLTDDATRVVTRIRKHI